MILRFIKTYFFVSLLFLLIGVSCKQKNQKTFSYNPLGYYFQLLSFNTTSSFYKANSMVWLDASFKTQMDSIFWDSHNNFNDNFFIKMDSTSKTNFLKNYVSKLAVLDSACLLIKTKDFYLQQYNLSKIPFFSQKDSIVKVNIKIRQIFDENEYANRNINLLSKETEQIENYFGSPLKFELAKDSLGFYWVEKPNTSNLPDIVYKDIVTLSYRGSYLNGRVFEESPPNFDISYGMPDQLLKGLNYVIKRLKKGQNAKIILPSQLAFGKNGSVNGTIAPYTPIVYEIKIIDVKNDKAI